MTVIELIDLLSDLPGKLEVTAPSQYTGKLPVVGVIYDSAEGTVTIKSASALSQ